jgi:hypothetical protein
VARDKNVVQVVMVEVKSTRWELENQRFLNSLNNAALGEAPWPMTIVSAFKVHTQLTHRRFPWHATRHCQNYRSS